MGFQKQTTRIQVNTWQRIPPPPFSPTIIFQIRYLNSYARQLVNEILAGLGKIYKRFPILSISEGRSQSAAVHMLLRGFQLLNRTQPWLVIRRPPA